MTHPTWELELDQAALVLMPCPGTKESDLQSSLEQLKEQNVGMIVTALSFDEMASKGVDALPEMTQTLGMTWAHAPIEDDQAPDAEFAANWQSIQQQADATLAQGQKVALHCMGGSGRTGLLAAHLLLARGWSLDKIIPAVQALRPGAFQKPDQVAYINQFAAQAK
ncbi:MAG: protein-tyrosine phosphatase family protein [Vibrio sp.]